MYIHAFMARPQFCLGVSPNSVNSRLQVLGGENTYLGGKFEAFFYCFLLFWVFFWGIWDSGGGESPPGDSWEITLVTKYQMYCNARCNLVFSRVCLVFDMETFSIKLPHIKRPFIIQIKCLPSWC